jgi:hypothetical protein
VALTFGIWLLRRRRPLSAGEVLLVAAASTMVIPWLLPEMHERYFYLAEVALVLAIAVDKRMILPAVSVQAASSITYLSYLGGSDLVPLEITAVLGLVAAVSAGVVLVLGLRSPKELAGGLDERHASTKVSDSRGVGATGASKRTANEPPASEPTTSEPTTSEPTARVTR